ncbi:putative cyclin-B3-1 isoform X3 [Primulina huaijiensis]|uniref:putative cyclin-B3-1 isoform X3 n=1 Tax=Primulina huaijiensis TaxID=1492673 RepID=UPI003CC79490
MVTAKGRLKQHANQPTRTHKMNNSGEVKDSKSFKVFTEAEKEQVCDSINDQTKGELIPPRSGGYLLNASGLKSGIGRLETCKRKLVKPVKINNGRKVLADISNSKGGFTKSEQAKNSSTEKSKFERMLYPQRDTGGLGKKKPISSEQHLRVCKISEESEALRLPVKQAANENIKATSYEQRSKLQNLGSITATVRISARIPLHLTRKSLPIYKQGNLSETSGLTKKNPEMSEKFKGKHGFPVKSVVRRSTIPKPIILTKPPWGSRASDGFVMKASSAQTKVDARVVLPRKSVKTNPKFQRVLGTNKLKSGSVASSKKKQDKGSVSKVIPSSLEELVSKEDLCGGASDSDRTSTTIGKKKSYRRNSYTRLLMSVSKDAIPKIYDDRNHLEVAEYVNDIYQYYWVMEGQNPLMKNYMEIQKEITPQMRGILINWIIEVHTKFDLMEETLFLTVLLLDRFLSLEIIKKNEMQLVGLTALLLASKYEDFWHPRVADLISISAETYTRDQMLKMEKEMLRRLKFRLNEPTLYVFMLRFIRAAQADTKLKHLAFYLIEICLVEYEALNYKPSMLCASAIYLARCTMGITPPWTSLLAKHARYEESQIRECAEMILKFHKASKTNLLKVTYDKYGKLGHGRAANIKPLVMLPEYCSHVPC